ncbi:hypothetical protein FRC08_002007 [Ceratobasidium sp. 394]|nr:hypothetical protein FRC08_002007 [Ceratobasidium sp. 394]
MNHVTSIDTTLGGTIRWMVPEQLRAEAMIISLGADIFSWGMLSLERYYYQSRGTRAASEPTDAIYDEERGIVDAGAGPRILWSGQVRRNSAAH